MGRNSVTKEATTLCLRSGLVEMWVKQDKWGKTTTLQQMFTHMHLCTTYYLHVGGLFVFLFDLLSNNRAEVTLTAVNSELD